MKANFMIRVFNVDSQVDIGQAAKTSIGETVWRAGGWAGGKRECLRQSGF